MSRIKLDCKHFKSFVIGQQKRLKTTHGTKIAKTYRTKRAQGLGLKNNKTEKKKRIRTTNLTKLTKIPYLRWRPDICIKSCDQ